MSFAKKSPFFSTLQAKKRKSIDQYDVQIPLHHTINLEVKDQLRDKFKTFSNWNYREMSQRNKKNEKMQMSVPLKSNKDQKDLIQALLSLSSKTQKEAKSKVIVVEELIGVKAERRQRFKRSQNPLHFIRHYMEKQNFKPSEQQMFMIERTIQLKKFIEPTGGNIDIEKVLNKIYQLMNFAVDYNQLKFLILLIILAADVCSQVKDESRAFYFYNEARIAATYANIPQIKTEALTGLAEVTISIGMYEQAIKILKKNLQYAWLSRNIQSQLMIYDLLGNCFYNQGKMQQADYYHTRYIQSQTQEPDSAIKKISSQMLNDYNRRIKSLEKDNLTSLFLEYLNIPITNFFKVPPPENIKKVYSNYKNGESPRKKRPEKNFTFNHFPNVTQQLQQLLKEDYEFVTEIPNPDMHKNYKAEPKYGRKRKHLVFELSSEFHRIIGTKPPKLNFQDIYKYPLEKRIDKVLSEKKNDNWWETMVSNTKKWRTQKVGTLKEKIRLSHRSYHKYPEQRKRSQSLKNEKIKESLNKTLLDWIDPIK